MQKKASLVFLQVIEKFGKNAIFPNVAPKTINEKFNIICPVHGEVETWLSKYKKIKQACWKCGIGLIVVKDGHKQCKDCKEWKPLDQYKLEKGKRPKPRCIECDKKFNVARSVNRDKEKVKANQQRALAKKQAIRQETSWIGKSSKIIVKQCEQCEKATTYKGTVGKRFCSVECSRKFVSVKFTGRKLNRSIKEYSCRTCKSSFLSTTPGQCSECKEVAYKINKKAQKKKRRAALRTVAIQAVIDKKVFDRDKWKCCNCRCKVQKVDILRDNAAEVDHIVPISLGGPHSYSNVQTLCRKCNQEKNNNYYGQLILSI
jgi:hypothetical protein